MGAAEVDGRTAGGLSMMAREGRAYETVMLKKRAARRASRPLSLAEDARNSRPTNSRTFGRTVSARRRLRSAEVTGDAPAPGENKFDARMLRASALRRGADTPRFSSAMRTRSSCSSDEYSSMEPDIQPLIE